MPYSPKTMALGCLRYLWGVLATYGNIWYAIPDVSDPDKAPTERG